MSSRSTLHQELLPSSNSEIGKSLLFPDMADRVSDDRYTKRLSIRKALADMPIGNRAQLKRWLAQVEGVFSAVMPNG